VKNVADDLGIVIGTKSQKLWEDVKKESLFLIEQSENNLIIQKEILKLAENEILKERKSLNSNTTQG
jgi:hypothetical protein